MSLTQIVPEPIAYTPPLNKRTVFAVNRDELVSKVKTAIPGDLIQLSAGVDYGSITFSYGTPAEWKGSTKENPLQILGAEDRSSTLGVLAFINASYIIVRTITAKRIGFNNSCGCQVIDCDISTLETSGILTTYQYSPNPGGYLYLNNRIAYTGPMQAGVWTPGRDGGGIHFAAGWDIGDNNRIAGNVISGWHDGIQCGTHKHLLPSQNLSIDRNFFYDLEDDAIEVDGYHQNYRVENNVIGGTARSCTAGISIAPGGPGPGLIKGNSISGYKNLPLKWNTDVDNADTQGCEVTENLINQTSEENIGWYFAGPINGVQGLNIHKNTFLSRGGVYITEAIKFPGVLDENRLYSTQEFPYSANAQNPKGCLFRFFDAATNSNKYYLTFADFQAKTGFEKNGKYAPFRCEPVAIPGFSVEKLCRWKVIDLNPPDPTPVPKPISAIGQLTLTMPDGSTRLLNLTGVEA